MQKIKLTCFTIRILEKLEQNMSTLFSALSLFFHNIYIYIYIEREREKEREIVFEKIGYHLRCTECFRKIDTIDKSNLMNSYSNDLRF